VRLFKTVRLENHIRILRAVKKHTFHIKCEKHIEDKGKLSIVRMDEVNLSFNKADLPDLQRYSNELVQWFLQNQRESISYQYPDSSLLISSFSFISEEPKA
jgi:hypothetical protein